MPELPEVRVVLNKLKIEFLNKKIKKIELFVEKSLKNFDVNEFLKIKDELILNFKQHGKNLIVETNNFYFVLHLRMEGKFKIINESDKDNIKYKIAKFYFDNNKILIFSDHRKFATINVFKKNENEIEKYLEKYGPEPWNINLSILYEKVKNKKTPIKNTLLDQKYMSGLGNIYVDEVLYKSKIHPKTKTSLINFNEWEIIIKNSIDILNEAIKLKGTTIKTFSSIGEIGMYQDKLIVHQRENKNCKNCNSIIKKIVVGGRGTYFCSKEQIEKE